MSAFCAQNKNTPFNREYVYDRLKSEVKKSPK